MRVDVIRLCFQDVMLLTGVYLFVLPLKAAEWKKIRNVGVCLVAAAVLIFLRVFLESCQTNLVLEFLIRFLTVQFVLFVLLGRFSWDIWYGAAWCVTIFYCLNILWEAASGYFRADEVSFVVEGLCGSLYFGLAYLLLEITLFRWMPRNGVYHVGPRRTLSALFILFFSQYSNYNYVTSGMESNLSVLVQIYCVTFLYLQAELFKKSELNEELRMMERLWYQQKRQYEIAKDQMQVIDRKCHDLKYQVAAMRQIDNPKEREKNLLELEKSIRIYDSIVKTGNEILDTLLSEKGLLCEAREITMHCVIDGKQISYMDSVDIYALFGNAIDNAIECVEKFPEKEKRFIDVCVAKKQGFTYIRISNPIEQNPEYEGDLPRTTKKNRQYHGIGLKSIRYIAEKYGGEISVGTELNCFVLEILLPQK